MERFNELISAVGAVVLGPSPPCLILLTAGTGVLFTIRPCISNSRHFTFSDIESIQHLQARSRKALPAAAHRRLRWLSATPSEHLLMHCTVHTIGDALSLRVYTCQSLITVTTPPPGPVLPTLSPGCATAGDRPCFGFRSLIARAPILAALTLSYRFTKRATMSGPVPMYLLSKWKDGSPSYCSASCYAISIVCRHLLLSWDW